VPRRGAGRFRERPPSTQTCGQAVNRQQIWIDEVQAVLEFLRRYVTVFSCEPLPTSDPIKRGSPKRDDRVIRGLDFSKVECGRQLKRAAPLRHPASPGGGVFLFCERTRAKGLILQGNYVALATRQGPHLLRRA